MCFYIYNMVKILNICECYICHCPPCEVLRIFFNVSLQNLVEMLFQQ